MSNEQNKTKVRQAEVEELLTSATVLRWATMPMDTHEVQQLCREWLEMKKALEFYADPESKTFRSNDYEYTARATLAKLTSGKDGK